MSNHVLEMEEENTLKKGKAGDEELLSQRRTVLGPKTIDQIISYISEK